MEGFFQKYFQMIKMCQVPEIIMWLYICMAYCQSSFTYVVPFSAEDSNPGVPGSPSVPLLSAAQWRIAALKVSLPFFEERELKRSLLHMVPWSSELRRSWSLPPF